jgi:hypothetical protein
MSGPAGETALNLLCQTLHDPGVIRDWRPREWNAWLPLVRNGRLLGRSLQLFEGHGLIDRVPQRLVDQMRGALAQTRYLQVQALRELRQVRRVLEAEDIPLIALKGVAYLAADLPPRGWRNLSDIDLLVPEGDIARAEAALRQAGWEPSGEFDAYDQHYYREWMHEVPPMVHPARGTEVDIHHNLAPPVSRIRIDAGLLWADAVEGPEHDGQRTRVLGPADMLLHNAVHLFMNDELRGGLRDVVDFRDLFEHFAAGEPEFGQRLLRRAEALGCGRALYYALSTAQRLAGLAVTPELRAAVARHAPPAPVAALMAWLIAQTLAPARLGLRRSAFAGQLLFIRSHWVRMPPGMLLRHLWHKAVVRRKPGPADPDLPG